MSDDTQLGCWLVGDESLLIQCAEIWLSRDHAIRGVVSADSRITEWGESRGIAVIVPGPNLVDQLKARPFDYLFSVTNLRMLSSEILDLADRASINFHDGPLPEYAGLNCPVWALLNGATRYGITWHIMEDGPDTGDILQQHMFDVEPGETALTLNTKCYEAGIESFTALADDITADRLAPKAQDLTARHYYGLAERPALGGTILWSHTAEQIATLVRALDFGSYANPVATAKVYTPTGIVRVTAATVTSSDSTAEPGSVVAADSEGVTVATGSTDLRLTGFATLDGEELSADEASQRFQMAAGTRLPLIDSDQGTTLEGLVSRVASSESFWSRRLANSEAPDLPYVDRSTPDGAPEHYRVHGWALPAETATADSDTLVAAFTAFLARLTGGDRFDVAYSDEALRQDIDDLTPWFASNVPLRVVAKEGESFSSFRASQAETLERVRKRLTYPRDLVGRSPDLRAKTGLDSYPVAVVLGPDGSAPPVEPVGHDLTVVFAPGGGATWIYNPDRLSPAHLADIERQFVAFLVQALNHPERPCADMPLLMGEELDRVLNQWNATERPVDDATIHHLIEQQAARSPDEPAVVAGGRTLTFDELNRRANQLARLLREQGVGDETLVGICLDRSDRMMVALLGVLKAGAAYVPLDPTYPAQRLAFMVQDADCGAVLTESHHLGTLPQTDAPVICLDTQWDEVTAYDDSNLEVTVRPDQLCYVIYTSGSTGTPKGVMVEHRNVANFFVGMDAHLGTDRGVWLAVTSLSFDISVLELFWTLARGFTVVLYAGDETSVPVRSTQPISFSLSYFAADEGAEDDKYRLLIEGAKFADAHGFEAVWTPERHYHAFGGLYPNPSVASSALAMITKQIHLRAGSVVLPLHHPTRVAEEWSVVDNLSNGRVGIAFAAGWMPNDFLIRPENFADKKNVMLRDLDIVRRLWRGETVAFPGPIGDEVEVSILPHPVQPELPFWITTAGNPETFAAAGTAGANLLTHLLGQTVEELREKLAAYRSARADAGHEGPGQVTLMLHTFVSDDLEALKDIVREPLKGYLSTATNLVKQYAWSFPAFKKREGQTFGDIDLNSLTSEEADALMEHAFERYFETSGLFGTPETCLPLLESLKEIDVDEIACLIDFGIDTDTVLASLPHLDTLRAIASPGAVETPATERATVGELIRSHGVTHMQCTPSMATLMLSDPGTRSALADLEHLLIGGEAFPPALADSLREAGVKTITNMYGPTETTIWSTAHRLDGASDGIPIGQPIANTEIYVLDRDGQPAPIGVTGELFIGGLGVVRGYLNRPDLTAERFVSHAFTDQADARLYRTGDVVRYREDGVIDFLGRVDHQVKVRGYRIELGEIESRLTDHPGVAEAIVVAKGEGDDRRLVGYIVTDGEAPGTEGLRAHLRHALPEFMVPGHIIPLDRLPLTPNAKVDRKALPDPETVMTTASPDEAFVPPTSDIEQQVAAVWQDVLKVPQIGLEDNFFDLGGHSLLVVQTHRRLKDDLNLELSITDMFRFPTVRSLASFLDGGGTDTAGVEKSVDRAAGRRAALKRRRGRRV